MREAGPRRGVGRLFVGAMLLAVGVSLGLVLELRNRLPLALAIATAAAALHFFWTARRGPGPWLRIVAWSGVVASAVGCLVLVLRWGLLPPRDSRLVEQFRTNRSEFESLRHLLVEEAGAIVVAGWGVRTPQSLIAKVPPEGDFPRARFEEYLALLTRAGGTIAFREAGSCPETCVIVWSSGWAGDTRHVAVCALCAPPTNLIDGLDAWWAKGNGAGGRRRVYRHLDDGWYLRADER